jgi:hypothetical protein
MGGALGTSKTGGQSVRELEGNWTRSAAEGNDQSRAICWRLACLAWAWADRWVGTMAIGPSASMLAVYFYAGVMHPTSGRGSSDGADGRQRGV